LFKRWPANLHLAHRLEEGAMSQTGANTRHNDADGASNAIEERLRLIIDAIPAII